jgi:hypothetical protein
VTSVALAARIPGFVKALPDATFTPAVEVTLQLAARWRMPALAEALVDLALNRVGDTGLIDPTAAPRLSSLAGCQQCRAGRLGARAR